MPPKLIARTHQRNRSNDLEQIKKVGKQHYLANAAVKLTSNSHFNFFFFKHINFESISKIRFINILDYK